MRQKWTIEQQLRSQNQRAMKAGATHDLTLEQWYQTLDYFGYKCAYCGGPYEVIEHYLPVRKAGTTISNCIPACLHCNVIKDRKGHDLSYYQNQNVVRFIESKGINLRFHIHEYRAIKEDHVVLCCDGCGRHIDVPGVSLVNAQDYINQYFANTGYVEVV